MRKGTRRLGSFGFTLVELLVVIGIIAVLIGILLPALNKARASSRSVACKSLLRQYAMASAMYVNENDGISPDLHRYADYDGGIVRYLNKTELDEAMTRCPADNDARLGTIGSFASPYIGTFPNLNYVISKKNGTAYTVRVSIGANISPMSASQYVNDRSTPTFSPRTTKANKLKSGYGLDVAKVMTWGDYQNTTGVDNIEYPMIRPGTGATAAGTMDMGTVVFRHNGAGNAAFLDGHVGQIRPKIKLINNGMDLAPGSDWKPTGWTGTVPFTMKPLHNHYQLYYPFGPGIEGKTFRMFGDFPTIGIE